MIQSKDEQDRLYKEAEASFAQRGGSDEVKESGDDNREQRIRDLEDRIRAEIMSRKNETPGYRDVQTEEQDVEEEEENDDDGDNDAGLLIDAISNSIEKCNEAYLANLMRENLEQVDREHSR